MATPGALAGLDLAQSRWGSLPWSEVVAPAAEVARRGFRLGSAAGYYLPYVLDSLLAWDPDTAAAVRRDDGKPVSTEDLMVIEGLADTLELIAAEGARALYDGELARLVVSDMADRGGLVTSRDLGDYRPVVRPALAAMLTLLGDRPHDVARLVEVQRRVPDVRRDRLDVADDREAAALDLLRDVGCQSARPASTAHVSVVDSHGTACAITASYGYGSGATVPGTGLWLNNCLGELELNRAPLRPGDRLRSNMAPTVGRLAGGAALAIGSPGADRITMALLQVLASFAPGDVSLQEAVNGPRLHVHHLDEGDPDGAARVEAEDDLPLPDLDLPVRLHHPHSMYFGGVGAALLPCVRRPGGSGRPQTNRRNCGQQPGHPTVRRRESPSHHRR